MNTSSEQARRDKRQYITFHSGEQEFGADIMTIREIRGWTQTTPLPHAPDYVCGVINLRGMVLPVIDLKSRLGGTPTEVSAKNVIIVVRCGEQSMGMLVDAVSDILTARETDIQVTPELARDGQSEFIDGIAVLEERMVAILNVRRLAAMLTGTRAVSLAA